MPGRLIRSFWIAVSLLHLAGVLALFAVFHLWPKTGWTAFLLYAPRAAFVLPVLITGIALRGAWRLLPAFTAALVLGPLMGLHLNGPGRPGALRVLTWNVWFGAGEPEVVRATLLRANPDLVLFQAAAHRVDVLLREAPFTGFTYLHDDQYVLASRWPARVVKRAEVSDGWRPWARFAVDSPWGTLDVFAVHPHSPRRLLGGGVRKGMKGERPEMEALQNDLAEIDELVSNAGRLKLVAGDFNVPERAGISSWMFEGMEDAFPAVGNGYGYTFPTLGKHGRMIPWMRLDRVLAGPGLKATRAEVFPGRGSDHAALLVELAPR